MKLKLYWLHNKNKAENVLEIYDQNVEQIFCSMSEYECYVCIESGLYVKRNTFECGKSRLMYLHDKLNNIFSLDVLERKFFFQIRRKYK